MTSIDERLESAGEDVRNAFGNGPMSVDLARPQRRLAGFALAFVLVALVIGAPAYLLRGEATPPPASGTSPPRELEPPSM
jgi:hypothetical protein